MSALPPDLHTLTGSYVLNALDDNERLLFEEHLAACTACQDEVDELQRTATMLSDTLATPVPAALRNQVMQAIQTTRQRPPVTTLKPAAKTARWLKLSAVAAGVALLAATGTLAVVVSDLTDQVRTLEQASEDTELLTRLLTNQDTLMVEIGGDNQASVRLLVAAAQGEGLLLADAMPQAPAEHAYAVWLTHHDGTITPAGLLRLDGDGRVFHPLSGQLVTAAALDVTVEPVTSTTNMPTGTAVMHLSLTNDVS
jgi:hypothetical protein